MSEKYEPNYESSHKAATLFEALGNYATGRDTSKDLERFETAWDGVAFFPVTFRGKQYELQQNNVTIAGLCGGIAIIGVTLASSDETLVYSPSRLFDTENEFSIQPPTLLSPGVQ